MANVAGVRTTTNIQQARRVVDMAEQIALLDPQIAPFITVLKKIKGNTRVAHSPKIEWLEDTLLANTSTVSTAISADTTTTLVVADGTIFRAGDIINIPSAGENMLITAVAANNLTVIRGFGTTAAAASIAVGAQVLNLGAAMTENSLNRGAISTQEKPEYNYTQIFRTPIELSKTEDASKLYGGKDRNYQRRKALQEHKRDIANAMYFGQRKEDTTGGKVRRSMGGMISFMSGGNVVAFNSGTLPLDYSHFDEQVAYKCFLHGSANKLLIAGPKLYKAINSWAVDQLVTDVGMDKTYGVRIRKLVTSYGDLNVMYDPLLAGTVYGGYGLALDMDYIRYSYLEGRDTKLNTNIQANDADGISDEYLTECTLEFQSPLAHVLITGAY